MSSRELAPSLRARELARQAIPHAKSRWHAYLEAYQVMPAEELLEMQPVTLNVDLKALISRNGVRAECARCGEEIINEREVLWEGLVLCRSCAGEGGYVRTQ